MALNLVVLLVVLGLAILLAWLMFRAAKIRRVWIRIVGVAGLAVPTLLIALIGALIGLGAYQAYTPRGNDVLDLQVEATPEKVERGTKIAAALCAGCHTVEGDPPLTGAGNLFDEIPLPLGSATPPNLTPGGHGSMSGRTESWCERSVKVRTPKVISCR